ncbi:MAG: hypothetical protein IJP43_01360 [Oscillospiraceae bacterium]|nr:hypothetical protein [Oscillospiraceae bacterium]
MKKILPVLIILALLASCAAPEAPAPVEDAPHEAPVETPVEAPDEPEIPPEPARPEYEPGEIDGDTYVSDYFSLRYTLPEGWEWITDSANANELGANFEMYSSGDEGLQTLSFTVGEGGAAEACATYLADLPVALEESGYTDYGFAETTVTIAGRECPAVSLAGTVEVVEGLSAPVYILAVFVEYEGRYGEFTATSFVTDANAEIIEGVTE